MLLLIYILLLFNVLAPNVSFWYALFPKFAILCKHLLSSGKCDLSDISWGRAVLCWYIIGGAKSCQITANEIGGKTWESEQPDQDGARHVEELKRSCQELTSTSSAAKRWPPAGQPRSLVTPSHHGQAARVRSSRPLLLPAIGEAGPCIAHGSDAAMFSGAVCDVRSRAIGGYWG